MGHEHSRHHSGSTSSEDLEKKRVRDASQRQIDHELEKLGHGDSQQWILCIGANLHLVRLFYEKLRPFSVKTAPSFDEASQRPASSSSPSKTPSEDDLTEISLHSEFPSSPSFSDFNFPFPFQSGSESSEPVERKKLDLRQLCVQLGTHQYQFLFAELKHIPISSKLWSRFPGLSLLFIIPLARCYNSSIPYEMELTGVFGSELPKFVLEIVLEYLGGNEELGQVITKYRDITSSHFFALSPVGILFTHEKEFTTKVHQEHPEWSDSETRVGKMICHEAEAIYDRISRTFRGDSTHETHRFPLSLSDSSFDSDKLSSYLSALPRQSHKSTSGTPSPHK